MKSLFRGMLLVFTIGIFFSVGNAYAQKVAFLNSEIIRKYYPDAKQAEQRIQSFVDEWNRELDVREQKINALEFEIKKNRLIWTASEKEAKEAKLKRITASRDKFAKEKFTPGGEYDKLVKNMLGPIENKIRAAINEVAADYRFDIIVDQSITPLPYVNYKYDMTINTLRKLGVDTKTLEEELKTKIEKDPRNQQKKKKTPRTRGRNTRRPSRAKEAPSTTNPEEMNKESITPEDIKPMSPEDQKKIEQATEKQLQKEAEEKGGK
jgi:outer membrane protein